jgi:hypothetical protein
MDVVLGRVCRLSSPAEPCRPENNPFDGGVSVDDGVSDGFSGETKVALLGCGAGGGGAAGEPNEKSDALF